MARKGRPQKYTEDALLRCLRRHRNGESMRSAAEAESVSYSAFQRWLRKRKKAGLEGQGAKPAPELRLVSHVSDLGSVAELPTVSASTERLTPILRRLVRKGVLQCMRLFAGEDLAEGEPWDPRLAKDAMVAQGAMLAQLPMLLAVDEATRAESDSDPVDLTTPEGMQALGPLLATLPPGLLQAAVEQAESA